MHIIKKTIVNLLIFVFFNIAIFAETIIAPQNTITIEVNESQIIKLAKPAQTLFIADPNIADIQLLSAADTVSIFARVLGETTFYALDNNGHTLASYTVIVSPNLSGLRNALTTLLPDNTINTMTVGNSIVLQGEVSSPRMAEDARRIAARFVEEPENVLNLLRVSSPAQINLRVRVMEVSREITRNIGIDWDFAVGAGSLLVQPRMISGLPGAIGGAADSFFVTSGISVNGVTFDTVISLLDKEGLVTVLSEPNLTTLSGETATFLAGGEFPIVVPQSNDRITIEFKKFGVSLAFTPVMLGPNLINLHVLPEVSEMSFGEGAIEISGFKIPSLKTRRAETTVELRSGQSFTIAGLIENNVSQTLKKFPGLANLPILGALFRSESFKRSETELVIVVTPYIVQPVGNQAISQPAEGLNLQGGFFNLNPAQVDNSGFIFN